MRDINYDTYYWQDNLVRLRASVPEDWEEGFHNLYDSAARRMLQYEIELPPTIESCKEAAQRFSNFNKESGRLMFTIETLDGQNVGGLNLNSIDEKNGTFSIGMQVDRNHRGKGYGTAAMRILLRYAFFERRLNKFHVHVLEGNVASATMLKKLGCSQEGVRKQQVYTNGKYYDIILFGLTREEFERVEMENGSQEQTR